MVMVYVPPVHPPSSGSHPIVGASNYITYHVTCINDINPTPSVSDWVGWTQTPLGACHAYTTFFLVRRCRHLHRPTFMPNNNKAQHFTHSLEHPIGCGSVAYDNTLILRDAFTSRRVCCRVQQGSHTLRICGRCERYSFGVYVALILGHQLLTASH